MQGYFRDNFCLLSAPHPSYAGLSTVIGQENVEVIMWSRSKNLGSPMRTRVQQGLVLYAGGISAGPIYCHKTFVLLTRTVSDHMTLESKETYGA